MRTGISITLKPSDRRRLAALARDRNAPHKHVWRAEIVLLSADGIGTHEIMQRTGKSKTCVWRWQERFMQAGYDGLCVGKRDQEFSLGKAPIPLPPLCNFGEFLAHFHPDLRELLQGIISIVRAAVNSNALWVLIVRHVENHPDVE